MIAYRICNELYDNDISGTGAKMFGARWNSKGVPMLYLTEHISLAVLEMLVHTELKDFAIPLSLLNITVPENIPAKEISVSKLKKDWTADFSYTRYMGDEFVRLKSDLLLKVPSAVVNEEHNFLVNPAHPDFRKIKISLTRAFRPDQRMFKIPNE